MKFLNNHVLLRVDSFFTDRIKIEGGQVLYIDTTTKNPKYTTTQGVVVAAPDKLVCCRRDNQQSLEWETTVEILPGDRVWFQFDAMILATKDDTLHWVEDGKLYVIIHYRWLYVAKRGEQVIPLNGYCLVTPVQEGEMPVELIHKKSELDISDRRRKVPNVARIKYLATPNVWYQESVYNDNGDLAVGDLVIMSPACDIPLEYDLYRSFDEKNEIYRVQRRYILGKVEMS